MRVQITSNSKIRISGERHESENKWRRFLKEVPTPPDSNTNLISANFENGMLYVKVPKATDRTKPLHEVTKKPIQETPNPEKPTIPTNQTQGLQKNGYQEKVPSKTSNRSNNIDEIKQVDEKKSEATGSDENKLKEEMNGEIKKKGVAANIEKEEITSRDKHDSATYKLRQEVQGLFRETKKNRFTDVIMAVIFLLCVGFYVKNAIINLKKESKTSEL